MRRLSALAGMMLLLAAAAPALAQASVTARVLDLSDRVVVAGTIQVRGEGSSPAGVKKVELFVSGVLVAKKEPAGVQSPVQVSGSWNTAERLGSGGLAPNGQYTVQVNASANGGGSASDSVRVLVDNPTSTPTGVSVAVDGPTATVSWSSNPEPDITGYRIERDSGSGFSKVGDTGSTTFSETPGTGDHSYRVVAVRSSPAVSGGRASSPSQAQTITITAPPPSSEPTSGTGSGDTGSGAGEGGEDGATGEDGAGDGTGDGPRAPGEPGSGRADGSGSNGGVGGTGLPKGPAGFAAGGRLFGSSGLPRGVELPPLTGLPNIAFGGSEVPGWGTYEETLPYELEGTEARIGLPNNIAAKAPWRIIPPDGLRWVAAGLWLLVTAVLARIFAARLPDVADSPAVLQSVTAEPGEESAQAA